MTHSPSGTLLVFDCDGVLVDTEPLVQRIEMEMIAELGWPITLEEIRAEHLGRPWPAGIVAGRAAGMSVIGYAGRTPRSLLSAAHTIIEDMTALSTAVAQFH